MIDGVTNAGALPVLERLLQFAGQRHRLIVNNIANIDTPDYRPVDLSTTDFQETLGEAIDSRRARHGNAGGELRLEDSQQIEFHRNSMTINPEAVGENILFHDRNDRNIERIMQDLVENALTFRMAAEFMRGRFDLINMAIRERI
ncbi:MAG: flagellar basal body rod protein FlgB [Planctomycetes bacterium]|nr:flagellar basal body rod protein FlgB [Planctomycetota bacterium]